MNLGFPKQAVSNICKTHLLCNRKLRKLHSHRTKTVQLSPLISQLPPPTSKSLPTISTRIAIRTPHSSSSQPLSRPRAMFRLCSLSFAMVAVLLTHLVSYSQHQLHMVHFPWSHPTSEETARTKSGKSDWSRQSNDRRRLPTARRRRLSLYTSS